MEKEYRKITAQGETLTIAEWSKKTGLHHSTITNRLDLGWNHEDIVGKPSDKRYATKNCKMSKNDAEMMLNDLEYHKQPHELRELIKETKVVQMQGFPHQAKYGQLFRRKHPAAFQKWFNDTYCRSNADDHARR
jgi:hypothetical protein